MSDLTFVVGDTAPSVYGTLQPQTPPIDLTGATVRFQMRAINDYRHSVDAAAVVVDEDTYEVRYDWAAGDLDEAGEFISRWLITYDDGQLQHTIPGNTITVEPA